MPKPRARRLWLACAIRSKVERHKRMDAELTAACQGAETENLEIGAIIQGTMERVVEVKVGDRMQEIVNTEILVEDA